MTASLPARADVVIVAARTVPASAMASPEAFVRYAASLVADDKAEPLELAQLQPPVSETAEPVDLQ